MEATVDLYSTILLLGAAHGLFLALALINAKGGNPTSHRLLALLTLLFSIDLGLEFLEQSRHITAYLRFAVIDINIDFVLCASGSFGDYDVLFQDLLMGIFTLLEDLQTD